VTHIPQAGIHQLSESFAIYLTFISVLYEGDHPMFAMCCFMDDDATLNGKFSTYHTCTVAALGTIAHGTVCSTLPSCT
jgi:hypothetical protein